MIDSKNEKKVDIAQTRSAIMSKIRSKDTKPEMVVRRLVHGMGYRYRLHRKDLPGKPDLVFPKRKKIIFVHGCFWHRHNCKAGLKQPKSNLEYWLPKLERNAIRDKEHQKQLINMGWKILVIWECKLQDKKCISEMVKSFLDS